MSFESLKEYFENKILTADAYQLQEIHYSPYSFGSGFASYNQNGKNIRINYDGRDSIYNISLSGKHEKYPNVKWKTVFEKNTYEMTPQEEADLMRKIEE